MEEAGMLDGDLITHINGECVSGEVAEDLVWSTKVGWLFIGPLVSSDPFLRPR